MSEEYWFGLVKSHLVETSAWARWRLPEAAKNAVLRKAIREVLLLIYENMGPDWADKFDWEAEFEKIIDYESAEDFVRGIVAKYGFAPTVEEQVERAKAEMVKAITEMLDEARELGPDVLREVRERVADLLGEADELRELRAKLERAEERAAKYRREARTYKQIADTLRERVRRLEEELSALRAGVRREAERAKPPEEVEVPLRPVRAPEGRPAKPKRRGLTEGDWREIKEEFEYLIWRELGRVPRIAYKAFRVRRRELEPMVAEMPREEAKEFAMREMEKEAHEVIAREREKRVAPRRAAPAIAVEEAPVIRILGLPRAARRYIPTWRAWEAGVPTSLPELFKSPIRKWEYVMWVDWLKKRMERDLRWAEKVGQGETIRKLYEEWMRDPEKAPENVRLEFRWAHEDFYTGPLKDEELEKFKAWLAKRDLSMDWYETLPEDMKKVVRAEFRIYGMP